MTPREKIVNWRLDQIVKAYSERVPAIDLHETEKLMMLAESYVDYTLIVRAFKSGCSLGEALSIFL